MRNFVQNIAEFYDPIRFYLYNLTRKMLWEMAFADLGDSNYKNNAWE